MSDNLFVDNIIGLHSQTGDEMLTYNVEKPNPLPCIVILIHGVNDIGEAYPNLDEGICKGLNKRLGRNDLVANEWETIQTEVDNLSPRIVIKKSNYSPVVPFFWGYRPVDKEKYDEEQRAYYERLKDSSVSDPELPYDSYWIDREVEIDSIHVNLKKLNCDKFGNWLDYQYHRNGGPFSDATTCIPDMYGPGMGGYLAELGKLLTPEGAKSYNNPHRIYLAFAAHRLANLIEKIRKDTGGQDIPINIVAHSQGTIITMLATLILAQKKQLPADCVILAHSPYAFEPATAEILSKDFSMGVQSQYGRETTFTNFVEAMYDSQKLRKIKFNKEILIEKGVISSEVNNEKYVQADNSVKHYDRLGKDSELFYRDNFGKVYNYFSPNDHVVSLWNVQGMGWSGIADHIFKQCPNKNLKQRVFSHGYIVGSNIINNKVTIPLIKIDISQEDYPSYISQADYHQRLKVITVRNQKVANTVILLPEQLIKLQQEPLFKGREGHLLSGHYYNSGRNVYVIYHPSKAELERDYPETVYQKISAKKLEKICIDSENKWQLADKQLTKTLTAEDKASAFLLAIQKCKDVSTGGASTVPFILTKRLINGEEVPETMTYQVDKPSGKTALSRAIHYNDIYNGKHERVERLKQETQAISITRPDYIPPYQGYIIRSNLIRITDKVQLTQLEADYKDESNNKQHQKWDRGIKAAYYVADKNSLLVYFYLTDKELKQRLSDLVDKQDDESSHHSGITMNKTAPANIMAYDLAIGVVKGIRPNSQEKLYQWRTLADWRHPKNYDDEVILYANKGILPEELKISMNYPLKGHMPVDKLSFVVNDFYHSPPTTDITIKLKKMELKKEKYQKLTQPAQWSMPDPDLKGANDVSN